MRFELLGIRIGVEGGAAEVVAGALAPLAVPGGAEAADVRFVAERVDRPAAPPAPEVFFHEPVRAGWDRDTLVVGDATARFAIRPGGARVDVALAPAALGPDVARVQALHVPIALAFALRHRRLFHLHAAVLADGERAVLVAGQAHAGKTTLAIALLEAGLAPLCDDAAYVAEQNAEVRVAGVARPFHLRRDTLRAFPRLAAHAGPPDATGRRDLDPRAAWPRAPAGALRPGLLLFPQIDRRAETTVAPLAPAEALGLLVEASALVVIDGAARAPEHLALLGRLASEAPAVRVALGQDLLERPVEVARAILAACRQGRA